MNCRCFQNQLHEYVEGSLSAGALAAADGHLSGCSTCRQRVRREQQFAQFLSGRLRQDTETLTLRPEIRRKILTASQGAAAPPAVAESVFGLWSRFLSNRFIRLAAIPASLLLVAAFLWISHFTGARSHETETARASDRDLHAAVSIQISYRLPARTFRREGNLVVDSLSDEIVVASGTLRPDGQEPQKLEIKTPL
jgi:anti-sigma factor RsiW